MKYQVVEKVNGISDEFTVVAKFDTESAAQEFAMVHYETRIGILSECACVNCVDGFIVDVDWWKSFQVSVLPDIDGVEPCEECGSVMTWHGDTWTHENTAKAGECYTAYRWGVK